MECAQLVKANSIEGCKKNNVWVNYTRWRNLLKTNDMVVGAISFHDNAKVRRINVVKNNSIVNKISKTKEERSPDLAEIQAERQRELILEQKSEKRRSVEEDKRLRLEREEAARLRSYA
jgi:NFACT protein RNA binding domain